MKNIMIADTSRSTCLYFPNYATIFRIYEDPLAGMGTLLIDYDEVRAGIYWPIKLNEICFDVRDQLRDEVGL